MARTELGSGVATSAVSIGGVRATHVFVELGQPTDLQAVLNQAVAAGATEIARVGAEHGWRIGRIVDPFGHEWEIGRPVGVWPPQGGLGESE